MTDKLRTPDAPTDPVVFQQYLITLPVIPDLATKIWGAVTGIAMNTAWVDYGTMSSREAAEYIKQALNSRMEFNMLGTIQAVIRETLDSSMLLCDGSVYNKEDYPQLWEIWPSAMKDAISLTLPDLRNLFLVGATMDYSLGDTGGTAEETLTIAQIPSHDHTSNPHTHSEITATPFPTLVGAGAPAVYAVSGVGATGFETVTINPTGGDEAHNNLPPYYAVVYAVIAKVVP